MAFGRVLKQVLDARNPSKDTISRLGDFIPIKLPDRVSGEAEGSVFQRYFSKGLEKVLGCTFGLWSEVGRRPLFIYPADCYFSAAVSRMISCSDGGGFRPRNCLTSAIRARSYNA